MNNDLKIDKIKHKTLVAQVMEKIRKLIASGQFKVHDRLPTENELAEMFALQDIQRGAHLVDAFGSGRLL
jgi:DNA-binding GntR family transcriptional regulator